MLFRSLRSATPVAFQLPVPGDSFGDGASMERGDQDDEVRIVLGNGARLRARGHFAQNTAGSPSGIALVATDAIVGRDQQEPVAIGPARDLDAGYLLQVLSAGTDVEGIAAGDLDGDGDLDLVAARPGSGASVFLNGGALSFVESAQRLGRGRSVVLGDVDRDGDLDVVIGSDDGEPGAVAARPNDQRSHGHATPAAGGKLDEQLLHRARRGRVEASRGEKGVARRRLDRRPRKCRSLQPDRHA